MSQWLTTFQVSFLLHLVFGCEWNTCDEPIRHHPVTRLYVSLSYNSPTITLITISSTWRHRLSHVYWILIWPSYCTNTLTCCHHYVTRMVSVSLTQARLPISQRHAIVVTPLLKKLSLDTVDMSNYQPLSNLSFVSKAIEWAIAIWLNDYFVANDLLPHHQSAYQKKQSTETATLGSGHTFWWQQILDKLQFSAY